MASKKKIEKQPIEIQEKDIIPEEEAKNLAPEDVMDVEAPKVIIKKEEKPEPKSTAAKKSNSKYAIGSIVFISKDADADLNGFKLFPQYKKYTYTVEAYDANTDVYTLRRLNLSLKLKEADIVAPSEKSDSSLIRKQY